MWSRPGQGGLDAALTKAFRSGPKWLLSKGQTAALYDYSDNSVIFTTCRPPGGRTAKPGTPFTGVS